MDNWYFPAALFLITMGAWLTWAAVSRARTQERLDDDAPKSSLAKDGPGPNPATAPRRGNGEAQPKS